VAIYDFLKNFADALRDSKKPSGVIRRKTLKINNDRNGTAIAK
jgi:hypothetical protein